MTWTAEAPQGYESEKIRYESAKYTGVGAGLDLGCGLKRIWTRALGMDVQTSPDGAQIAGDIRDLSMFADGSMPWIFSSHALEHIQDTEATLKEWWRTLKVGGYLVLYLPHKRFYPNIGQENANPDHKHDFVPNDIVRIMYKVGAESGWDLCEREDRDESNEYSFYIVFRKADHGDKRDVIRVRAKKTALVCRYGGVGDILQAASVLPGLKRQGFHVTMMTTPKGRELLREDPHIDDWWLQDEDQVPNGELHFYWAKVAKRFDRFVNLSESVEGTWLAYPGRAPYYWPHEVRKAHLGGNYLEFSAELAGVPYRPELMFYQTKEERRDALDECEDMRCRTGGLGQVVLWCLSGSSIHKSYPFTDAVVARLLSDFLQVSVVLVGDEVCKLLETGWENEPRVACRSGQWTIRQTLAFAQVCDVVVGPETGVLNSVAFDEEVRKVIFLSHSAPSNLTRDWVNTVALEPEDTPCWPCHRIHIGREYCHIHEDTHAALCAQNIHPGRVVEAIVTGVDEKVAFPTHPLFDGKPGRFEGIRDVRVVKNP